MSDMTEYELLTQGACHCLTPDYDGRDPMRNRPYSNGTDTTMPITRYGLGREYSGNTGSPPITEQEDGAYVRYEDFQKMEAAHKAHNEMLVLRTKKAESAWPGVPVGWKLVPDYKVGMRVKFGGEEYEIFARGDRTGTFDICHPTDSHRDRWTNVPPDQLEPIAAAPVAAQPSVPDKATNLHPTSSIDHHARALYVQGWNDCREAVLAAAPPAGGQDLEHPIGWKISFTDAEGVRQSVLCGHNSVGDYRGIDPMASSIALGPFMPPPQQDADKANVCEAPVSDKPACGAQNAKCERQAEKVDAQPSDDEIVSMSKALIAQRGADATDAERYRWLVGHSMPSVGYPYKCTIRLPRGYSDKESLDAAIDQAIQQERLP